MKTVICRGVHGESEEVPVDALSFRPSVYGVIIKDDKVLLSRQWDGYDFPGGGVDLGETLEEALEREIKEETGLSAKKDKLVLVKEDFFTHPGTKKHFQSILLYFSCKDVSGDISTDGFDEHEKTYAKEAQWIPLGEIDKLKFYNPIDSVALIRTVKDGKGV